MSYEAELVTRYAGVRERLGSVLTPVKESRVVIRSVPAGKLAPAPRVREPFTPEERIPLSKHQKIISEIADKYDISYGELIGDSQSRQFMGGRKELYYRLWNETSLGLTAIGRLLKRDRTTVRAGIISHEQRLKHERIAELRRSFTQEHFSVPARFPQKPKLPRKSSEFST